MTTKKSTSLAKRPKQTPAIPKGGKAMAVIATDKNEVIEQAKAKLFLSPSASAAVASEKFFKNSFGEADVPALIHNLELSMKRVNEGDLKEVESMLMGQAVALQTMFMSLSRRAFIQDTLPQYEAHFRLALRAQAQCCRTLETLATMKNPPVVLARQANVTTGPQQINNGILAPAGAVPACGESKPEPNELLESNHVERMDARTKSKAS